MHSCIRSAAHTRTHTNPTLMRQALLTSCLGSTTSTSGSLMATSLMQDMSKPYTLSHPAATRKRKSLGDRFKSEWENKYITTGRMNISIYDYMYIYIQAFSKNEVVTILSHQSLCKDPYASFWFHGYQSGENCLDIVRRQEVDSNSFSGKTSHGTVLYCPRQWKKNIQPKIIV